MNNKHYVKGYITCGYGDYVNKSFVFQDLSIEDIIIQMEDYYFNWCNRVSEKHNNIEVNAGFTIYCNHTKVYTGTCASDSVYDKMYEEHIVEKGYLEMCKY